MEKRGLKFFILRSLAHQLQNWADFVSRQAEEAVYPVQPNQIAPESSETEGSLNPAPRLTASMPSNLEPEQAGRGSAFADTPPAHWLARVQKDAPELLEQMQQARQNSARPAHPLSATQNVGGGQANTWPEPGVAGSGQMGKAEGAVERKQATTEHVEMKSATEASPVISAPVTPASFRTIEAPGQQDVTEAVVDGRHIHEREPAGASRRSELPKPLPEVGQKDALELMEQRQVSGHDGVSQFQSLPPTETMDAGQRARRVEIKREEKRPDMLEEAGTQQSEARKTHRDEVTITAAPNVVPSGSVVTGWSSASNISPGFQVSPAAWLQQDDSLWGESQSLHSVHQSEHSLWPRESLSAGAHGIASGQEQEEVGWPALPDTVASNDQDWEVALRLWERRRRLNEEQRGSPWNV